MEYALERKWVLWEMWNQNGKRLNKNFKENMKPLSSFDNLIGFWQHWNHLPHSKPATLFTCLENKKKPIILPDNLSIEAIGIFQEGITPAWEDPVNANGCDLSIRKPFERELLKEMWDALVFSVIGESLPHAEEIVGCRIVDKEDSIKFELWLKTCLEEGAAKVEAIREEIHRVAFSCIQIGDVKIISHKERVKTL